MMSDVNHAALARIRAAMNSAQAELLIVDQGELLAWLTGYSVSETLYRACLVPLQGEPWMVLRQLDEAPCRQSSWLREIVTFDDHQSPWQRVADSIEAKGYGRGRIAADFNSYGMTVHNWRQLQESLPAAHWVDMTGVSDQLRQVKFPQELACLQQAADIADRAMSALTEQVRSGWRVRDAAALAAACFLRDGADTGETGPIVCARSDNGFLHNSNHDHRLAAGDILHVELIPKVSHYSARIMRPIFIGQPTARQQQVAHQLIELQDRQLAMMTPDTPANEVDALLREGVLAAGLRRAYGNVTGYALGLYTRTPRPSDFSYCFTPAANWRLEENMVFHMYASAQGIAFSETVQVTSQGGKRLSRLPRQAFIAPY
ncbi:aminopeptidase P family protein [Brenneria goodwinii]|nr:Xaa-Pro peptidase family protein [Brenneria goodwinii]MCG8157939.1 aminopeptidase P family protein [Brenneria goodwinii]MCG8162531.1 aminopeptidase P family protein [Brenneria goodwinii]MCG8166572.1 aminopeptidase P family protein [Brenneria goodwinii]MCG8172493.1 aminopeptidase P family protein [Brenneria goodwinii]MCG8175668.1 aminopeptidase P family protein [Brenneria goodwinii]